MRTNAGEAMPSTFGGILRAGMRLQLSNRLQLYHPVQGADIIAYRPLRRRNAKLS